MKKAGPFVVLLFALFAVAAWFIRPNLRQEVDRNILYSTQLTTDAITPIPRHLILDQRKVDLGRRLFFDPRFSHDNSISCGSCHDLNKAGQDGRPIAIGIDNQLGENNTPTVLNAAFNFRQFWDGRAADLIEQENGPVHNPKEMASNWPEIIEKLKSDPTITSSFHAIWPDSITIANIHSAIAEYERSLITPDSPFDNYLRGHTDALTPQELEGWQLFQNLGCVSCHQGINIGGNMFANLGIMGDFFKDRGKPEVRADRGRFNVTGDPNDMHLFKVPSLRNVALTAPYFHDGSVESLEQAVDIMSHYQLGVNLTTIQRSSLIAFLKALNGTLPDSKQ